MDPGISASKLDDTKYKNEIHSCEWNCSLSECDVIHFSISSDACAVNDFPTSTEATYASQPPSVDLLHSHLRKLKSPNWRMEQLHE